MFPKLSITLSRGNLLLLLVFVAGAVAWTIFIYRRTRTKGIAALSALRAISLALLLFLLFSPLLSLLFSGSRRPLVALVVDTSSSMGLEDVPGGRMGVVKEIVGGEGPVRELEKRVEVRSFQFSDRLYPASESLKVSGERTQIGTALAALEKEMGEAPQAVLLLTDGGNNSGPDPIGIVQRLGFPVFPLGIGSSEGRRDGSIEAVELNEICYAGDSIPVQVLVRTEGFVGETSELSLREGRKILGSSTISLTREAREQSIELSFMPKEPGTHTYEVLLPPQPGELSEENNRRSVRVEVLKSKIKVLSISSHPSWDLKFLFREMASDPNLEITSLTELGGGKWLLQRKEEDELVDVSAFKAGEWDVLLLKDLEEATTPGGLLVQASERLESRGGGAILWGDHPPQLSHLSPLIRGRGEVDREFSLKVTEAGLSHPVMGLSKDPFENKKIWEALPPLTGCQRSLGAKGGAEVLAVHPAEKTGQGLMPVIALQRYGRGKVLQIAAYSFWRWSFLPRTIEQEEGSYSRFWSNLFRWLSARRDINRLLVKPTKGAFEAGEEIEFAGQLYDGGYRPLSGALVKVTIKMPEGPAQEIPLFGTGEGRYEGSIRSLPPGEYRFRAQARVGGEVLKGEGGEVLVEPYGLELREVKLNEALLRRMAEESGGKYYTPEDLDALEEDLRLEKRRVTRRKEIELASNPLAYLLIVFLLTSEWLVRRRKGLP